MRPLLYVLTALAVIGLAMWAYQENYRTQKAVAEVETLNREIGETRAAIAVLRAEWAYLNRPDRLRDLAMANFDHLRLMPLRPEQFARVDQIRFADPAPDDGAAPRLGPLEGTIMTAFDGGRP